MPLDIAMLATTVVGSFLMPYVKKGAEKIAEEVTHKFSDAAAEHVTGLAQKVWDRVTGLFTPKEQPALEMFKENPDEMQAMIEKIVKQKLEENLQVAQEVDAMIHAPAPGGQMDGIQIMNAGVVGVVNMPGANFQGAQNVTITAVNQGGQPPTEPTDDPSSQPH